MQQLHALSSASPSILDECGCGQFATVYKGSWCEGSNMTEVAVKTLSVDASMEERIRFLQEAHVMSQFSHSNIVQLFGVIAEGNPVSSLQANIHMHYIQCYSPVFIISAKYVCIIAVSPLHDCKLIYIIVCLCICRKMLSTIFLFISP